MDSKTTVRTTNRRPGMPLTTVSGANGGRLAQNTTVFVINFHRLTPLTAVGNVPERSFMHLTAVITN